MTLLVLGLGNVLCGDDGAGVVALARLARQYEPGADVRLLDGGTLGLSLLPYLEEAHTAVLIDAVDTGAPPGTLVRLTGEDVGQAVAHRLSPHQVGVADLLDGARLLGREPGRIVLWGIVPERIALEVGLSPKVAARIDDLCAYVAAEVAELGFELDERRDDDAEASLQRDVDERAHRILGVYGG
jgi:hydrogenase maturation protease